jgi:hypothetical protein
LRAAHAQGFGNLGLLLGHATCMLVLPARAGQPARPMPRP